VTAFRRAGVGYPAASLLVALTIGLLKLFRGLNESSVALLLLLAVFLAAWVWQSGPGVLAAMLATAGFNFFFLPPLHTFTIQDPRNVAALFVFLVSGLLIGRLSALSRERLRQVEAERRDLVTLTRMSEAFMADTNRESLLGVVVDRIRDALQCQRVSLWLARDGAEVAEVVATPGAAVRQDLVELAYRQGNSAEFPSELGGTDIYLPVPVGVHRAGVLVARGIQSSERLAEGCAVLLGLALERERFLRLARAAEETKASEQMKSTLLASLAHDLKTPVATTRAAVENWMAEAGPSDKSQLALDQMKSLSRRIDELMEVVRLDSGVARPRRERVTAGEIVEAAISRFGEALQNHTLFIEPPPPDAVVEVDPGQLTEALGHGLENAAGYSPKGSPIRISVLTRGDSVLLQISDRGSGVPAVDRERVFERFVRLPASEFVPGTGLGLSIARSLVEMNGGQLRLQEAGDGGTTFEIELPRVSR
jgi:two-component system, OmpR family, sensor histidine kinase KdpD